MQNSIMRFLRPLFIALLLVTMVGAGTACNAVRLGYSNGETLSYWWLDKYIDVNAEQKPWVKKRLAGLFEWHRRTQLQGYTELLTSVQQVLQRPVSKRDLVSIHDEAKKQLVSLLEHALPDLATLALALQPSQIRQLENKFAENNDKYRQDYLAGSVEKRQRARYKKTMEQAEYWFGNFSREQEAMIRQASDARSVTSEMVLEQRIKRQQALIRLLRTIQVERPGHAAAMEMLRQHAVSVIEQGGEAEYAQIYNSSRDEVLGLTGTIINSTTPAQKAHAVKRLQQWIDDFNRLATRRLGNAQQAARN